MTDNPNQQPAVTGVRPDDLTPLKAKAFDILMRVLDGKHQFVRFHKRPIQKTSVEAWEEIAQGFATVELETINVYEWVLRMNNRTDLRSAMLDQAAEELRRG